MAAITATTKESALTHIFAKANSVFYYNAAITASTDLTAATLELPVLEDSISFDTGDVDKTEINLIDGTIWTSKSDKGDSSITFQVAALDDAVASLFLSAGSSNTYKVNSTDTSKNYSLDIKKATGGLVFVDDTDKQFVILPNVEMTGSLVVADGDNPAYFNVTVTPKKNTAGDAIVII